MRMIPHAEVIIPHAQNDNLLKVVMDKSEVSSVFKQIVCFLLK